MLHEPHLPFRAVIFDFDGVILDSATLKTDAFAAVYAGEDPDIVARVVEYQEAHGGIGRREKFAYFERDLLGREPTPERLDALCDRFAKVVDAAMRVAPFIRGAEALLDRLAGTVTMYVVTGMPEADLVRICRERGLASRFERLIGTPTTKPQAFRSILAASNLQPPNVVAVGDSTTEFDAARGEGIGFLAVVPPGVRDRFPKDVRKVPDFLDLDATLRALSAAATANPLDAAVQD